VGLECNGNCIVQFHRLRGAGGELGGFGIVNSEKNNKQETNAIVWSSVDPKLDNLEPRLIDLINAINGSKVFISGSVLIRTNVESCRTLSWSVVTQTVDSSNNLFYGSSDLTAFCTEDGTLLIVLPVHAIWANVYGVKADFKDPAWRALPEPPGGHDCDSAEDLSKKTDDDAQYPNKLPIRGIHNCSLGSGKFIRFLGGEYNRLTLPGVSQGTVSLAPWASGTKATFDVQAYESTRWGPGWVGLQVMYEHDRKLADDFNSFTAAATYDLRMPTEKPFWVEWGRSKALREDCGGAANAVECGPPLVGVRPLEFILRAGPEWSPSAQNVGIPPGTDTKAIYVPRDLNFVAGPTLRLPIIISPPLGFKVERQPSQFSLVPVFGLEAGVRVISHPICSPVGPVFSSTTSSTTSSPDSMPIYTITGIGQCQFAYYIPQVTNFINVTPETKGAPRGQPIPAGCPPQSLPIQNTNTCTQPQGIFRRVAGVDASMRWPYNLTRNFLGDRPITLDFSYRMRWLSYAEPFYNNSSSKLVLPEQQSSAERFYTRVTLIFPFSAYVQARATWQHGSLPPLFQYVRSIYTIGLTFSNPGSSER
jgi:hypothetical protein